MIDRIKGWALDIFEGRSRSVSTIRRAAKLLERQVEVGSTQQTVARIQQSRLDKTLRHAFQNSPHYLEILKRNGIARGGLGLDVLQSLPFTTSKEIREWERFVCVPEERLSTVFTTSGTTGEPKRIFFTSKDMDMLTNFPAVALRFRNPGRMVVLIALPTSHGLWVGSASAQRIVERAGGLALPVGADDPEKTLKWMERFNPNIVISSPSYMSCLTRQAQKMGFRRKLDRVLLSGEGLSTDQKAAFVEHWGASVLDSYGTTEIGGGQTLALPDCTALHLNDLHIITEIVDFETGKPADDGELVFTTLLREAMPLIRYRSGDRARWAKCSCNLPFRAIQVFGRLDDMMVAGDMNLYGSVLAKAISAIPGASGKMEILLDKVDLSDRMTIRIGGEGISEEKVKQALLESYPEVKANLANGNLVLAIETNVNLDGQLKAVKIHENRKK